VEAHGKIRTTEPDSTSFGIAMRPPEFQMPDLSAFPIAKRWPAKHPDRLQLYSLPTPNGVKVSIALEEIGLPYERILSISARTSPGRPNSSR
jgi:hypothetical protein